MKVSKTVLASAALIAASFAALPASADEIDRRQYNQSKRIEQGLRDGSLTRQEAARLKAEQDRIAAMERQAERDGRLTREEKARIDRAQDQASKHIYQERHDSESRWSRWKRSWRGSASNDHGYRSWYRRWW